MPSLVSLLHRIFKYIHFNIALIQENKRLFTINLQQNKSPKTKKTFQVITLEMSPTLLVLIHVSLIDLIQSRTTCEGITTLHINLYIRHRKTDRRLIIHKVQDTKYIEGDLNSFLYFIFTKASHQLLICQRR